MALKTESKISGELRGILGLYQAAMTAQDMKYNGLDLRNIQIAKENAGEDFDISAYMEQTGYAQPFSEFRFTETKNKKLYTPDNSFDDCEFAKNSKSGLYLPGSENTEKSRTNKAVLNGIALGLLGIFTATILGGCAGGGHQHTDSTKLSPVHDSVGSNNGPNAAYAHAQPQTMKLNDSQYENPKIGENGCIVPQSNKLILPGYGKVELTGTPRRVWFPEKVTKRPEFIDGKDEWIYWKPETIKSWLDALDTGKFEYFTVYKEFEPFYPPLEGKFIVEFAAGSGCHIKYWVEKVGPRGQIILTDVDPNACSAMACDESDESYARNVIVLQNLLTNPCLPIKTVDLLFIENLHTLINTGTTCSGPGSREWTYDEFLTESGRFLHYLRDSLKDNESILAIAEGHRTSSHGDNGKRIFLTENQTIDNIERNGFSLVYKNDSLAPGVWGACFKKR